MSSTSVASAAQTPTTSPNSQRKLDDGGVEITAHLFGDNYFEFYANGEFVGEVLHFPKGTGDDPGGSSPERFDAMEYVARVLSQIPEPRKHQVRYYGYYSCAARGKRQKHRLRSQ